jgi:hypothetical protein
MATISKTFPYPYLASFSRDYKTAKFGFSLDYDNQEGNSRIVLSYTLENPNLQDLIRKNVLGVFAVYSCTGTALKAIKPFAPDSQRLEINIKTGEATGKIRFTLMIVAEEDFDFQDSDFSDDYQDISFKIEKGNVIGESDDIDLFFNHREADGNKRSLFVKSIDKNMLPEDGARIIYRNDVIDIAMSQETYTAIRKMEFDFAKRPLIFSTFLVPALATTLALMNEVEGADGSPIENPFVNDNEDKAWFQAIEDKLAGKEYNAGDEYAIAQRMLGEPLAPSVGWIEQHNNSGEGE